MKKQIKRADQQSAVIDGTKIVLCDGSVAIVDVEDFAVLSAYTWRITPGGYASRNGKRINGKRPSYQMHREITGCPTGMEVDHINGNRLDNRRANLRICTRAENGKNQSPQVGRSSIYKGVDHFKRLGMWRARIKNNGRSISLGYFKEEADAALAYNAAAIRYFGDYAKPNVLHGVM